MEQLHARAPFDDIDAGSAYLVGLLCNFGTLVLAHTFPPQYARIRALESANPHILYSHCDVAVLGMDREMIGAALLACWDLPPEITQPIREQHAPGSIVPLARLLRCARSLLASEGVSSVRSQRVPEQDRARAGTRCNRCDPRAAAPTAGRTGSAGAGLSKRRLTGRSRDPIGSPNGDAPINSGGVGHRFRKRAGSSIHGGLTGYQILPAARISFPAEPITTRRGEHLRVKRSALRESCRLRAGSCSLKSSVGSPDERCGLTTHPNIFGLDRIVMAAIADPASIPSQL